MDSASTYILLLAKHPRQVRVLTALLQRSCYTVELACTEEQAVVQADEHPPFLVILTGNHQDWSSQLLSDLRHRSATRSLTLVALTDFHAPSWMHQEENPGFDGFLVNPISSEVLHSLVESAYTRRIWCSAS
jgi:AmiR/NasT family two-component response regulator